METVLVGAFFGVMGLVFFFAHFILLGRILAALQEQNILMRGMLAAQGVKVPSSK
jgi:hypothetical protein